MSSKQHEKITKSWSSIDELTLIKDVVTKGENIDLCVQYLSDKRKISKTEYEVYFKEVVDKYIQNLLLDKLIGKAEIVLINMKRNANCVLFQFAQETNKDLKELILKHIRKKDGQQEHLINNLQFYWDVLKQIKTLCIEGLPTFNQCQLEHMNFESFMKLDDATQQRLLIQLHYTGTTTAITSINVMGNIRDKNIVWQYLVETENICEIIHWCTIQQNFGSGKHLMLTHNEWTIKYNKWSIEKDMYEKAVTALGANRDDCLRNCFIKAGYIFSDELSYPKTVLRRISITNSYKQNKQYLDRLQLGELIWETKLYYILLQDLISYEELNELVDATPQKTNYLINLIKYLRNYTSENTICDDFMKISKTIQLYLKNICNPNESDVLLVRLIEFLYDCTKILSSSESQPNSQLVSLFTCKTDHNIQSHLEQLNSVPYELMKSLQYLDVKLLQKKVNIADISKTIDEQTDQQKELMKGHHLNYIHYIKQSRSAYATFTFLIDHLNNYGSITKTHLWAACQSVYVLCIKMASDDGTIVHSMAFCEMLGFDTQYLRCLLKLMRGLSIEQIQRNTPKTMVKSAERNIIEIISKDGNQRFPLNDFKAIMLVKSTILYTSESSTTCTEYSEVLKYYATNNNFWQILVLVQYFEIPLKAIKNLCKCFKIKMMGDHLIRALSNYSIITELQQQKTKQLHIKNHKINTYMPTNTTSVNTSTSSGLFCNKPTFANVIKGQYINLLCNNVTTNTPDLFAIILLNTNHNALNERFVDDETFFEYMQTHQRNNAHDSLINFLKCSIDYNTPLLSILAAAINPLHTIHVKWCWLVWLSVSTRQWQNVTTLAIPHNDNFPWNLMELLIQNAQLKAIARSLYIFYPENAFVHLFRFLDRTKQLQFDDTVIHELKLYGLALTNDKIQVPFISFLNRNKLISQSIRFLLLHLQYNFHSAVDQQEFLNCICKSGLSDIIGQLDFCLLGEFHKILNFNENKTLLHDFTFKFIDLMDCEGRMTCNEKYEQILNSVLKAKEYKIAVSLAMLLEKPVSNIIYNKWINSLDVQLQMRKPTEKWDDFYLPLDQYEEDVAKYSLPPGILVNFLLHATSCLPINAFQQRYLILHKTLNIIKYHHLFPNESFDRDQIEYDMILSYMSLTADDEEGMASLPIYNSEYYEQIMIPERCVLYKSFWELKELAGIDDFNIRHKPIITDHQCQRLENLILHLLDEGDIVEALRLQELFQARPLDLRLVVFCMALAEGLSTVRNMLPDELELFATFENATFSKFNKRTLSSVGNDPLGYSISNLRRDEISYKEKQRTLAILQGFASKIKYGVILAKRITCVYRAAMYLDKEYIDILRTKDIQILLQSVAKDECSHRLLVVSDIFTSTQMGSVEIAELLAHEITTAIIRPCFYIFNNDSPSKMTSTSNTSDLWGYDVNRDLHLFLELTPNRIKLGICLLEYCDALSMYRQYHHDKMFIGNAYFERLMNIITITSGCSYIASTSSNILGNVADQTLDANQILSHKKQNIIYIELLINAHQCFVNECSMEGIANVLKRAKSLNMILIKAKSWRLIVRLLTGIGRYREMSYCFDALIANEQFESLLGQFEDNNHGLRQAILAYLREYSPSEQGKELFKLSALHFLMYKELAEFWQQDAQALLMQIYTTSCLQHDNNSNNKEVIQLRVNDHVITILNRCLEYYIHATENYILDNKFLAAQNCAIQAELVALQIDLARKSLDGISLSDLHACDCLICLTSREHFKDFVNNKFSVSQSLILSRAYNYDINWSEALLHQFIIKLKPSYLGEFLLHINISDDIIESVNKSFHVYNQQHETNQQMEQHLMQLIDLVQSVTLKYKLASMILSGKTTATELINNHTIHYLRDVNFGRHD